MSERSKYIAILAVAAALILIIGSWLRPRQARETTAPPPSEAEITRIAALAARRSLEGTTSFFAAVADQVRVSLAELPETRATGVIWGPDLVMTSAFDWSRAATTVRTGADETAIAPVAVRGPDLPFTGLRLAHPQSAAPATRAATAPKAGDSILAVWKAGGQQAFAPGTVVDTMTVVCGAVEVEEFISTLSLSAVMAGGGLFDLDGRLLGLIVPCDGRFIAMTVRSVDALTENAQTPSGRMLARYGLRVAAATAAEAEYFGAENVVIVREVWTGLPADRSGLSPGDLIRAVNDAPVTVPAGVEDALTGDAEPLSLTVIRRRATRRITLRADGGETETQTSTGGLTIATAAPYVIEQVESGSAAARVGLRSGDRILQIDQTAPRSAAQVASLLTERRPTAKPVFLEVEREGRRLGLLLP